MRNYKATNPCPICGRYKTAYKDKCFGFITTEGQYAYCSREASDDKTIQRFNQTCWRHPLQQLGGAAAIDKDNTKKSLRLSIQADEENLVSQKNTRREAY